LILCKKCKRIWPGGTVWCGSCRATLGCRICPEGHKNELLSRCCTICGSAKLSKGVPSVNLRGFTWIAVLTVLVLTVPPAICYLADATESAFLSIANRAIPILMLAGVLSVMTSLIFGPKAAKEIGECWLQFLLLPFKVLALIFNIAWKRLP
jgi:hypothetical protein